MSIPLCNIFVLFFVPARDVRMSLAGTNGHPKQEQERMPGMDIAASAKGTRGSPSKKQGNVV